MTFAPIQCSAPGKVILFGEHAVVYGQPAIAVPVTQVQATATVELAPPGNGLTLVAPDLEKSISLTTAPQDDPLAVAARLTLAHLSVPPPDAVLTIHSTIPIAGGLGSGAATAAAAVRALAIALGHPLDNESINTIVYEVEKIHHGTPSGIDNTVVTMAQPIYFVRGRPIELIAVGATFTILIGDTGVASPTKESVAYVRRQREKHPAHYDALCDQIGDLVVEARQAIDVGDPDVYLYRIERGAGDAVYVAWHREAGADPYDAITAPALQVVLSIEISRPWIMDAQGNAVDYVGADPLTLELGGMPLYIGQTK